MQKDSKLFDDIARLASSATGGFMEIRREIEALVREQVERMLRRMNLVTREEFETVREMAAKARDEQEKLKEQLTALEKKQCG